MRRAPTLLAAIVLAAPGALLAQRAPTAPFTLTLSRPEVEYAEPFSLVAGVRELRDGRVIVADRLEKSIQLVDLAAGTATKIGAEGGGPNEYRMPFSAFAMPGDSTLVFDAGNLRYLVVAPNGSIARTFNPAQDADGPMSLLNARGVDGEGNLYFLDRGFRPPAADGRTFSGSFETPDSGTVMRYELKTGRTEPVGKVALAKMNVTASGGGGQQQVMMRQSSPFAAQDDWTAGLDGRIAIVRHDPYRVEWLAPNGQRVVGPTLRYTPIPVTERDKEEFRNRANNPNNRVAIRIGGPGGGDAPRTTNRPMPEPTDWPEVKPPFLGNAATVGPDGRLWVLRTRAAGDDVPSYDVFDSYGKQVGTVKLPASTRLIGFGRNSAYLIRTDEDDLQYLQRHKLF
jgi:hypothetical protein